MPFLFRKIDYRSCHGRLSKIYAELERKEYKMKHTIKKGKKDISELDEFVKSLLDYIKDLRMVVSALESLASRYEQESEGFFVFPLKEQRIMFDKYQRENEIFNKTKGVVHFYLEEFAKAIKKTRQINNPI